MSATPVRPLIAVAKDGLPKTGLTEAQRAFAEAEGFAGETGRLLSLPQGGDQPAPILFGIGPDEGRPPVSYTHLRAHETVLDLVCRLLLEKKNTKLHNHKQQLDTTNRQP